jgi:hypothetical protein
MRKRCRVPLGGVTSNERRTTPASAAVSASDPTPAGETSAKPTTPFPPRLGLAKPPVSVTSAAAGRATTCQTLAPSGNVPTSR